MPYTAAEEEAIETIMNEIENHFYYNEFADQHAEDAPALYAAAVAYADLLAAQSAAHTRPTSATPRAEEAREQ